MAARVLVHTSHPAYIGAGADNSSALGGCEKVFFRILKYTRRTTSKIGRFKSKNLNVQTSYDPRHIARHTDIRGIHTRSTQRTRHARAALKLALFIEKVSTDIETHRPIVKKRSVFTYTRPAAHPRGRQTSAVHKRGLYSARDTRARH